MFDVMGVILSLLDADGNGTSAAHMNSQMTNGLLLPDGWEYAMRKTKNDFT